MILTTSQTPSEPAKSIFHHYFWHAARKSPKVWSPCGLSNEPLHNLVRNRMFVIIEHPRNHTVCVFILVINNCGVWKYPKSGISLDFVDRTPLQFSGCWPNIDGLWQLNSAWHRAGNLIISETSGSSRSISGPPCPLHTKTNMMWNRVLLFRLPKITIMLILMKRSCSKSKQYTTYLDVIHVC